MAIEPLLEADRLDQRRRCRSSFAFSTRPSILIVHGRVFSESALKVLAGAEFVEIVVVEIDLLPASLRDRAYRLRCAWPDTARPIGSASSARARRGRPASAPIAPAPARKARRSRKIDSGVISLGRMSNPEMAVRAHCPIPRGRSIETLAAETQMLPCAWFSSRVWRLLQGGNRARREGQTFST